MHICYSYVYAYCYIIMFWDRMLRISAECALGPRGCWLIYNKIDYLQLLTILLTNLNEDIALIVN